MDRKYAYCLLALSIATEQIGTACLEASKGYTVRKPTIIAISAYIICFAAFGRCLMDLNLGIAWASWGAVGTIVTPIAGYFFYRQRLTKTGVVGLILIVVSTITLNLFG